MKTFLGFLAGIGFLFMIALTATATKIIVDRKSQDSCDVQVDEAFCATAVTECKEFIQGELDKRKSKGF